MIQNITQQKNNKKPRFPSSHQPWSVGSRAMASGPLHPPSSAVGSTGSEDRRFLKPSAFLQIDWNRVFEFVEVILWKWPLEVLNFRLFWRSHLGSKPNSTPPSTSVHIANLQTSNQPTTITRSPLRKHRWKEKKHRKLTSAVELLFSSVALQIFLKDAHQLRSITWLQGAIHILIGHS